MSLRISKDELHNALQLVQHAAATRTTLPILTGILLQVGNDGTMSLTATDLEVAIRAQLACQASTATAIVVPSRYFSELVRRSPSEEIELQINEEDWTAVVRWPGSKFTVNGYEPSQFPQLPMLENPNQVTVESKLLLESLQRTLFSVSVDETRPILTGVQLRLSNQGITAISTDGFRISYARLGHVDEQSATELVVPGRSLQQLARVLPLDKQCTIEMGENQVLFRSDGLVFLARTLNDNYPAVLELIPKEFPTRMECDRRLLLAACERMALIADMRDRPNGVKLTLQTDKLVLQANSPDVGEAYEELDMSLSGNGLDVITFNARYLIDGLKAITDDNVTFEFSGPMSAARLYGSEDDSYEHIVLPMRSS